MERVGRGAAMARRHSPQGLLRVCYAAYGRKSMSRQESSGGEEETMHEPSWEVLTLRVDRLEAENRWWKRLVSVTLLLLTLLALFGATAGKRVQSSTALRGQRLALVDKAERVRAEL